MFLALSLVVASTISLVLLLVYQLKYKPLIEMTKDIPSAPSLPIIGHAHYFIGREPSQNLLYLRNMLDEHGHILKVWLGPELNILMDDPKDVEVILSSMQYLEKSAHYKNLVPWLQQGLLISRGRKWHKRRKVITPAFHFKILDQHIDIFEHDSRQLISNLMRASKGNADVNMYDWINLCTLDSICGNAFAIKQFIIHNV